MEHLSWQRLSIFAGVTLLLGWLVTRVALDHGVPIANAILTVENEAQALARARKSEKDKGGEAAKAAVAMLELQGRFAS